MSIDEIRKRHEQASNPESFMYRHDQCHQDRGYLLDRLAELEAALTTMVEAEVDYMTRNNLGDPEQLDRIKQARKALKGGEV